MTVALRGTTTSNSTIGGSSVAVTAPSGLASGDLIVAMWWSGNGYTYTNPSGWTQAYTGVHYNTTYIVAYKVATGSEPGSYTFSISGTDDLSCQIQAYQTGTYNTGTPLALHSDGSISGATYTAPSATTTINGSLYCCVYINQDQKTGVLTAPSGMTLLALTEVSDGEEQASYYGIQATAGATGNQVLVWNNSGNGGCYTFVVQAAAGAPAFCTVSPSSVTLSTVSGTTTLSATVQDSGHNTITSGFTLAWTSGTPGVATINSSTGVVTAVSPGTSVMTAAVTGGTNPTGTALIVVQQPTLTGITVSPSTATVNVGSNQSFTKTAVDQFGVSASPTVVWGSSVPAVASVNGSGLATGVSGGSTNITASNTNISAISLAASYAAVTGSIPTIAALSAGIGFKIPIQQSLLESVATAGSAGQDAMVFQVADSGGANIKLSASLVCGTAANTMVVTVATSSFSVSSAAIALTAIQAANPWVVLSFGWNGSTTVGGLYSGSTLIANSSLAGSQSGTILSTSLNGCVYLSAAGSLGLSPTYAGLGVYSTTLSGSGLYNAPTASDPNIVGLWVFDGTGSPTSILASVGSYPLILPASEYVWTTSSTIPWPIVVSGSGALTVVTSSSNFVWASSANGIMTVAANGATTAVVTRASAGTASISASTGGQSGASSVTAI